MSTDDLTDLAEGLLEDGCGFCGGEIGALGILGRRVHLTCRDCGAETSVTAPEREAVDA